MNIEKVLKHIVFFTTKLPHRGSTTQFEKQAVEYTYRELIAEGYKPVIQTFKSAVSAYYPALIFGIGIFGSIHYFISAPSIQSALIALCAICFFLTNILLDSAFKTNIYSLLLPRKNSQNVIAQLAPVAQKRQTLVLIAHLDSHRTPLLFSSPFWVRILKILVPGAITCSAVVCILMILYAFTHFYSPYLLIFLSLVFFILILLMAQADLTPYTTGANDNASGAATLLALASYFRKSPLMNTELYFVFSGCEEVGSYGARAFAHKYKDVIPASKWFTIDGLSASGAAPAILAKETFLLSVKSDPKLINLARKIILDHPSDDAFILPEYNGAYTDSSPGSIAGFKVISLVALKENGELPSWHTLNDNLQHVDKKTLQKCVNFSIHLISAIDKKHLK